MRTRCLLILMLAAPAASADESFRDEHIEVELICEHSRLRAGRTALVGIRFVLQPGWHVYWKNPGDSGRPPRVEWDLPDRYSVSELAWPAPRRIPMPPLVMFGYDDEVLLLAELTVPPDVDGTVAQLAARVSWLTCADVCVEGEARLDLALPVTEAPPAPDPRWREAIDAARARTPQEPEPGALGAAREGDDVRLAVRGGKPKVYFPARAGEIEFGAPQPVLGHTIRLRSASTSPLAALDGVLVLADGRAWIVDTPIGDAAAPPATVAEPPPQRAHEGRPSWAFFVGAGLVVALALIALIQFFG
jgi:thiol:disulfide interchange protein DsbD